MSSFQSFRIGLLACSVIFGAVACMRVDETLDCGTPSASHDAGSGGGSGSGDGGGSAGSGDPQGVAANLQGLRWELPCTAPSSTYGCVTLADPGTTTTTLGGTNGTVYDVVLRFRGVIEQRTYQGGTEEGYWYVGGDMPDRSDPFNIYSLGISSPAQLFYVNAGSSFQNRVYAVDYTETVQIAAGATVTLTADSTEGTEIMNLDPNGNPEVVPGVAPAPAAYDGQFLQMDVVSVTPHSS
jgi:hypothetical protein